MIERGERVAHVETLASLAESLGVTLSELFSGTDAPAEVGEQDADEGYGCQQGVDEADDELHDGLGCQAQVVGDAIFRIDLLFVGHRKTIIALIGKPAREQLARQPFAPDDLQRHSAADHGDGKSGAHNDEHDDGDDQRQQCASVALFQCIEEPLVPAVDADVHRKAHRFARLLVDEIKLYNQVKVSEGRKNKDLYDRLKEDIEKSRATYQKRYGNTVAGGADYFSQELVRSLAEEDTSIMGANFRRN